MEQLNRETNLKGQITLPKGAREQLFTGDYLYLNLGKARTVLEPVSCIDESENLILRNVQKEGHTAEEEEARVNERKLDSPKALQQELHESVEAEQDWREGTAIIHWPEEE